MGSKRHSSNVGDKWRPTKHPRLDESELGDNLPDSNSLAQQPGTEEFRRVESSHVSPIAIDIAGHDSDESSASPAEKEAPRAERRGSSLTNTQEKSEISDTVSTATETTGDGGKYDTCFGLVETTAMIKSSTSKESKRFPVKLQISPASLKLEIVHIDQKTIVGLSNLGSTKVSAFNDAIQTYGVVLTATAVFPAKFRHSYVPCALRIIVYGCMASHQAVAETLGLRGLYLQHPYLSEYDDRVPYFNPQYLVRPGGSMPPLEDLKISGKDSIAYANDLTAHERRTLLEIFDCARGPDSILGIRPSSRLKSELKEHQITALAMMIEKECNVTDNLAFPALWELKTNGNGLKRYRHVVTGREQEMQPTPLRGGILADEMGLGKTLSAISLVLWHLDGSNSTKTPQDMRNLTLIVAPKSTIPEWNYQFERHVQAGRISVLTYHGNQRHHTTQAWGHSDVVLTTYGVVRSEKGKSGPLFQRKWARVILDEAHKIRNRVSENFKAVTAIDAPRRWCLTGTPIQNRLDDIGALVSFIQVDGLHSQKDFNRLIASPIKNKKSYGLDRLRSLVKAICLRRTKDSVQNLVRLPQKEERDMVLSLTGEEKKLYEFFRVRAARAYDEMQKLKARRAVSKAQKQPSAGRGNHILVMIGCLRLICDHGESLLPTNALKLWHNRGTQALILASTGSLAGLDPQHCDVCASDLDRVGGDIFTINELECGHVLCEQCSVSEDLEEPQDSDIACPKCSERSMPPSSSQYGVGKGGKKPSVKVIALLENLRNERALKPSDGKGGTKSVVFSFWTKMLDLVQQAFHVNGVNFRRIDGQSSLEERSRSLQAFRDDPDCWVMLASIGSVGEGVNLTAANFVHILEPQWNPMVEAQAVDRVHRIGQERDVVITRYLIKDSVEFYVREIQQEKLRMIHQSLSTMELEWNDVVARKDKMLSKLL